MFKRAGSCATFAVFLWASFVRGQQSEAIRGNVVDAMTKQPIAGATVLLMSSRQGVVTNEAGKFKLSATQPNDSLLIRFIGYRSERLALAEINRNHHIQLTPTSLLFHEVTVTANRNAAVAADSPAPVELVTTDTPRLLTTHNVGETLTHMQSLLVKDYGGLSGIKTVSLRGASEGQVLVLQDGFRINNPQGGWVDLNLLPTLGVESVEVLRSGASAQYGSEAVGGIVHVRTLSPAAHFSPQAEYTVGNYGTGAARIKLSQRVGKISGVLAYGRLRTEGDYPTGLAAQPRLQNNHLNKQDFYARGDFTISERIGLSAFHQIVDSDREVAGSLSFPTSAAEQQDNNRMSAVRFTAQTGELFNFNVQGSLQHLEQDYTNPDPFFPSASRHTVDARELLLHNRSRLGVWDFLYGAEIAHFEIKSTDLENPQRDQRSAFVQAEWRWHRVRNNALMSLAITPALRYDHFSDSGNRTSPKISLVWKWEKDFTLSWHASAGKSFRVPSMNDLFWPSSPYTAGNPNLRPEVGTQFDGGVLVQSANRAGNWQLAADVFHTQLENLISWIPDENFRFSPQNIARAKIAGLEPALTWRSLRDRVNVRLAYTKMRAIDDGDDAATQGKRLLYRPDHKFDATFSAQIFGGTWGATYQLISRRFVRQDNSFSLPGYRLLDLFGSYRFDFTGGYQIYLAGAIRNLADKRIQVIEGYPIPGREFRLTLGVGR